jgi:hypothetical protein
MEEYQYKYSPLNCGVDYRLLFNFRQCCFTSQNMAMGASAIQFPAIFLNFMHQGLIGYIRINFVSQVEGANHQA